MQLEKIFLNFSFFLSFPASIGEFILTVVKARGPEYLSKWYLNPWVLTGAAALLIKIPLSLIHPLSKLSKVSVLSLVIIVYGVLLIIVKSIYQINAKKNISNSSLISNGTMFGEKKTDEIYEMAKFNLNILKALTIFGFSYANHYIMLECLSEMKRPTKQRVYALASGNNGFVALVYVVCALLGYFAFVEKKEENILSAMSGIEVDICRIGFAIMMALSYPLVLSPARDNLIWLLHELTPLGKNDTLAKVQIDKSGDPIFVGFRRNLFPHSFSFYAVTVGLVTFTYLLANSFPSVSSILNIFFSISGGLLVFCGPSVCYFMLLARMSYRDRPINQLNRLQKLIAGVSDDNNSNLDLNRIPTGALIETEEQLKADATFAQKSSTTMNVIGAINIIFGLFVFFVGTSLSIKDVIQN